MTKPNSDRDEKGRFARGNPGGPGRAKGRGYELQRAAQDAVTPEHVSAMMRRAMRLALEGNLTAMRFVMERTVGRAPEAQALPEPISIDMPELRTASDCATAIDALTEAICTGAVNREQATLLMSLVQARLRAIEVRDLEERLMALEQQTLAVEIDKPPGRRRR
ncbi:MAG TPA: hypothetical protein EYP98_03280 [Planctomycetes bacterium]|nr:hypothetical protein [Planctomycetota bacterium]